jgi:DNA polymerase I-like protein with 3'-5' exonuclease and polymerase domains
MIIQGSASDLVKSAMVKIEKNLRKSFPYSDKKRGAYLVMQLHDELIYEVNQSD